MVRVAYRERLEDAGSRAAVAALVVGDAEPVAAREGEIPARSTLDQAAKVRQRAVVLSGTHGGDAGPPQNCALIVRRGRRREQAGKDGQAAVDVAGRHEGGGEQHSRAAPLFGRGAPDPTLPQGSSQPPGALHVAHAHRQPEVGQPDGRRQRTGWKALVEGGAGGYRGVVVTLCVERLDAFRGDALLRRSRGVRCRPFVEQLQGGLEAGSVAQSSNEAAVLRFGEG